MYFFSRSLPCGGPAAHQALDPQQARWPFASGYGRYFWQRNNKALILSRLKCDSPNRL
jgi:hypothetical protein